MQHLTPMIWGIFMMTNPGRDGVFIYMENNLKSLDISN